jgi:hypothetical protein
MNKLEWIILAFSDIPNSESGLGEIELMDWFQKICLKIITLEIVMIYITFMFLLLCWVGVHFSIYKGSYNVSNISYLNSSPPLLFFIPPPRFLEQFTRYHFCIYMHVYTLFALYSSFYPYITLILPSYHHLYLWERVYCWEKNKWFFVRYSKENLGSVPILQ